MIRAAALLVVLALPAGAEGLQPAELPPADYAGLQYVDSEGCIFARAGTGTEVLWIPRVSRQGVPDCGQPPSGQRVPVVEEVGLQPVPAASTGDDGAPTDGAAGGGGQAGGLFVAIGSFADPGTADRARAKLAELEYDVVRGQVQGASGTLVTVFAGPFPDAEAAGAALQVLRQAGFPEAALIGP